MVRAATVAVPEDPAWLPDHQALRAELSTAGGPGSFRAHL